MKTKVTLKKVGYQIKGVSDLTPWGGGNGCIDMKPFNTKTMRKAEVLANINDAGFGVESINGAICDVYILFENGYKEYLKTMKVGTVSRYTRKYYNNNF